MTELFQFTAVLSALFFAAIAIYINLGEHPARMECGREVAATVFGPSYKRASKIQVGLIAAATSCSEESIRSGIFVNIPVFGDPALITGSTGARRCTRSRIIKTLFNLIY
jgi:hypothetical protein